MQGVRNGKKRRKSRLTAPPREAMQIRSREVCVARDARDGIPRCLKTDTEGFTECFSNGGRTPSLCGRIGHW